MNLRVCFYLLLGIGFFDATNALRVVAPPEIAGNVLATPEFICISPKYSIEGPFYSIVCSFRCPYLRAPLVSKSGGIF